MILCYQVATPDVAAADSVTAYQGPLENSFATLSRLGYDGVELMTLDPGKLDWSEIRRLAQQYSLDVALLCTGEVYGQMGISFADPDETIRERAVKRICEIIEMASFLGANINIGRVRGQYIPNLPRERTDDYAIEAFRAISDYAAPLNVKIALETVTIMQTNFINTLAEARCFIERVKKPNFMLMMDVFHLNLEEKNMYSAIRDYKDYNCHVHLADNNRRYPGNCGFDFKHIIESFADTGYNGAFCTEIYQLPSQDKAAEGAITHLKPIFQNVYRTSAEIDVR